MNLKQYAVSAAAFILENLPEDKLKCISRVILFGSVAQGTATRESDVDLFFDIIAKKKELAKINRLVKNLAEKFYTSNTGIRYRLEGIGNKINPIAGKLEDWQELRRSIAKSGIILYGTFIEKLSGEPYLLIWWEGLEPRTRGAFINALYGVRIKDKRYPGLLEKLAGRRVGKSAIILPLRNKAELDRLLDKYKIGYRVIEISLV